MSKFLQDDYSKIGEGNLLLQFAYFEKVKLLLRALLNPFSGAQASLQQLLTERHLDKAKGKQLDGIGDILGLSRSYVTIIDNNWWFGFRGQSLAKPFKQAPIRDDNYYLTSSNTKFMSDDYYRRLLRWKIIKNNSHGTVEDIIRAYQAIFQPSKVEVREVDVGKIEVIITRRLEKELEGVEKSAVDWCPVVAGIKATVSFIEG